MQLGFKNKRAIYIIEITIINKLFSGMKSFGNNPYINNLTNMQFSHSNINYVTFYHIDVIY